jgi:hypothetical protein
MDNLVGTVWPKAPQVFVVAYVDHCFRSFRHIHLRFEMPVRLISMAKAICESV